MLDLQNQRKNMKTIIVTPTENKRIEKLKYV